MATIIQPSLKKCGKCTERVIYEIHSEFIFRMKWKNKIKYKMYCRWPSSFWSMTSAHKYFEFVYVWHNNHLQGKLGFFLSLCFPRVDMKFYGNYLLNWLFCLNLGWILSYKCLTPNKIFLYQHQTENIQHLYKETAVHRMFTIHQNVLK